MAISVGDKIPSAKLKRTDMSDITTEEIFGGKKVVVFAVPGAFTPTCSNQHLPGFVAKASEIKAKGVDEVVCMSVNDAFVMKAWGEAQKTGDEVLMLADGNAEFSRAIGLDFDGSGIGFGTRAQRFAMVVNDGVVELLNVDAPMKFEVSDAETILAAL